MSKAIINTFKKLDTDTSQNKQDPSSFYDAQDLRLISDEPLSNGALVNYKGTKAKINIGSNKFTVVGYAEVGSDLVLLLYNAATTPISYIAKVALSENDTLQSAVLIYSDESSIEKLGFYNVLTSKLVDNIETIGRYENEYSKKIYFAVPDKPLRVFNISDYVSTLITKSVSTLDVLPNNSGSILSLGDNSIIQGGRLESGKIQYACKLFNKYGSETTFSTCSELISLTSSDINNSTEFKGSDLETNSNKSVRVNIVLPNTDFNYIHIYSIHYRVKDTPVISLVGEMQVPTSLSFSFIDNGTILDTITLEEFNIFGGNLISAETIGTKNNILFAANTKEINDTITLDCRAYRYDNVPLSIDPITHVVTSAHSLVYEDDSTYPPYYDIAYNGDWIKYIWNTGTHVHDIDSTGSNWDLPDTANCINKYNDEFLKTSGTITHTWPFDRNAGGVAYGGTGYVVSYQIKVDANPITLVTDGETIVNAANETFILKSNSFKQGEVYRMGLTAFDLKGKPYFNNWIGDIRIPYFRGADSIFETSGVSADDETYTNISVTAKNIYIEFTIDSTKITDIDKISGFQITRVERTIYDKSVVAQGSTMGGVIRLGDTGSFAPYSIFRDNTVPDSNSSATELLYKNIHLFYSPEFNINNGIDFNSNDYRLYIANIYTKPIRTLQTAITSGWEDYTSAIMDVTMASMPANNKIIPTLSSKSGVRTYDVDVVAALPANVGISFDVNSFNKVGVVENNGSSVSLDIDGSSYNYLNRVISNSANVTLGSAGNHTMYSPSMAVLSSNFELDLYDTTTVITYVLDLYANNASSRYGGNTYYARTLNQYLAASGFIIKISGDNVVNTHGDIYNTVFDTLTSIVDVSQDDLSADTIYGLDIDRRQVSALIPLESSINCALTGSKASKHVLSYPSGGNISSIYVGLMETELKGIQSYGEKYPKIGDLNLYNTAYSSIPKYPTYFPEPNLFDSSSTQPNFIYASEKKINGEYVDSWSKFLYANGLEVEGIYGAIHKLTTLDNKLYFFQEGAIGVAAVNDRYIIGAGDAAKLSLGTGTVLERFDYVKYNEGIIKPQHVINTITNLYFIDHNRKVIDIIGNSDIALSIEKGVNTLFRSLYKDSNSFVTIGFDPVFREVFFTIGNTVSTVFTGKTLVYNENMNMFQPRSSTVPNLFLNISDGLLSFKQSLLSPSNIPNYVYKHNAGYMGELYSESNTVAGTDKYYSDSTISILVNTNSPVVFVTDNIEFRTEVRAYDIDKSIFDDKATYSVIGGSDLKSGAYGDALKTVDHIEFQNSYQKVTQTTIVKQDNTITSGADIPNTSRRHRSWTTAVPMFIDVTTGNNTRFIDTFLSMKFTFNNISNKVFKLHDIITYIRPAHK